jgi:hypothetical protein
MLVARLVDGKGWNAKPGVVAGPAEPIPDLAK